jgi:hypothetical protein
LGFGEDGFGVPSILSSSAFTSAEKCLVEAILTVPDRRSLSRESMILMPVLSLYIWNSTARIIIRKNQKEKLSF